MIRVKFNGKFLQVISLYFYCIFSFTKVAAQEYADTSNKKQSEVQQDTIVYLTPSDYSVEKKGVVHLKWKPIEGRLVVYKLFYWEADSRGVRPAFKLTVEPSYLLRNLLPGSYYYWQVESQDLATGKVIKGSVQQFKTAYRSRDKMTLEKLKVLYSNSFYKAIIYNIEHKMSRLGDTVFVQGDFFGDDINSTKIALGRDTIKPFYQDDQNIKFFIPDTLDINFAMNLGKTVLQPRSEFTLFDDKSRNKPDPNNKIDLENMSQSDLDLLSLLNNKDDFDQKLKDTLDNLWKKYRDTKLEDTLQKAFLKLENTMQMPELKLDSSESISLPLPVARSKFENLWDSLVRDRMQSKIKSKIERFNLKKANFETGKEIANSEKDTVDNLYVDVFSNEVSSGLDSVWKEILQKRYDNKTPEYLLDYYETPEDSVVKDTIAKIIFPSQKMDKILDSLWNIFIKKNKYSVKIKGDTAFKVALKGEEGNVNMHIPYEFFSKKSKEWGKDTIIDSVMITNKIDINKTCETPLILKELDSLGMGTKVHAEDLKQILGLLAQNNIQLPSKHAIKLIEKELQRLNGKGEGINDQLVKGLSNEDLKIVGNIIAKNQDILTIADTKEAIQEKIMSLIYSEKKSPKVGELKPIDRNKDQVLAENETKDATVQEMIVDTTAFADESMFFSEPEPDSLESDTSLLTLEQQGIQSDSLDSLSLFVINLDLVSDLESRGLKKLFTENSFDFLPVYKNDSLIIEEDEIDDTEDIEETEEIIETDSLQNYKNYLSQTTLKFRTEDFRIGESFGSDEINQILFQDNLPAFGKRATNSVKNIQIENMTDWTTHDFDLPAISAQTIWQTPYLDIKEKKQHNYFNDNKLILNSNGVWNTETRKTYLEKQAISAFLKYDQQSNQNEDIKLQTVGIRYSKVFFEKYSFELNTEVYRNTNRSSDIELNINDKGSNDKIRKFGDEELSLIDLDRDGKAETNIVRKGFDEKAFSPEINPINYYADATFTYRPSPKDNPDLSVYWTGKFSKNSSAIQNTSRYRVDNLNFISNNLGIKDKKYYIKLQWDNLSVDNWYNYSKTAKEINDIWKSTEDWANDFKIAYYGLMLAPEFGSNFAGIAPNISDFNNAIIFADNRLLNNDLLTAQQVKNLDKIYKQLTNRPEVTWNRNSDVIYDIGSNEFATVLKNLWEKDYTAGFKNKVADQKAVVEAGYDFKKDLKYIDASVKLKYSIEDINTFNGYYWDDLKSKNELLFIEPAVSFNISKKWGYLLIKPRLEYATNFDFFVSPTINYGAELTETGTHKIFASFGLNRKTPDIFSQYAKIDLGYTKIFGSNANVIDNFADTITNLTYYDNQQFKAHSYKPSSIAKTFESGLVTDLEKYNFSPIEPELEYTAKLEYKHNFASSFVFNGKLNFTLLKNMIGYKKIAVLANDNPIDDVNKGRLKWYYNIANTGQNLIMLNPQIYSKYFLNPDVSIEVEIVYNFYQKGETTEDHVAPVNKAPLQTRTGAEYKNILFDNLILQIDFKYFSDYRFESVFVDRVQPAVSIIDAALKYEIKAINTQIIATGKNILNNNFSFVPGSGLIGRNMSILIRYDF